MYIKRLFLLATLCMLKNEEKRVKLNIFPVRILNSPILWRALVVTPGEEVTAWGHLDLTWSHVCDGFHGATPRFLSSGPLQLLRAGVIWFRFRQLYCSAKGQTICLNLCKPTEKAIIVTYIVHNREINHCKDRLVCSCWSFADSYWLQLLKCE